MKNAAMGYVSGLLKVLWQKPFQQRREERYAVPVGVFAQLATQTSAKPNTLATIDVLDISRNGMAFVAKIGSIEIGDEVEIVLDSDVNGRAIQKGRVLCNRQIGQTIGANGRHAIRRFSIQFQSELDANTLENIRTMRLATPA